ncbi:MAG: prohead core scaffolding protein and protease [Acidobacteria bacterium]|nr:prohead core scaffolding protein and protease [Acidobacteriota bacterium]|tara:strand:+ start:14904 stop:15548 length:645 start_codon:yes stop_codon:yes gene_type:complete
MELLVETWSNPHLNESNAPSKTLVEAKDNGKGALYIEGIFLQAEVKNRNGRIYPKNVLEEAVDSYVNEQVSSKQSLGELNHPKRPYVDPSHAAIIIEKLWWEGNNVMGRARVIEGDGGAGDKTAALLRAGWIPGVSSRGLGVLEERNGTKYVKEGYKLTVGVDVVWGPSAPEAYGRAVQESNSHVKETNKEFIKESSDNKDDNSFLAIMEALKK